jgi:hypothetical protein
MKHHNHILAALLVIQVVLSAIVFWPRPAATGAGEPLFSGVAAGDIVALRIAEADGKRVQLSKVNGDWVLPDAGDYPAQADSITSLLDKMVGLTTARLVTRTDGSHKRLQVAAADFVRRIDFETDGGTKYALYLGSSPRYGATHFRVDGRSETYLTADLSTWDATADASSWVDVAYVEVSQDSLTEMTLANSSGTFVFAKGDEGNWTMEGLEADEILDEAAVTGLVRRAASVNMTGPLGKEELPAYGMGEPNAVVTLETDEKTVTLRVGAQDPDTKGYVAISSESPYYVRVSEFAVKDLVEKMRDDFIQAPVTPTPE